MRFDNARGVLHRELLDIRGGVVERGAIAENPDPGVALTKAQCDLRTNWRPYRATFFGDDHDRRDVDPAEAAQISERIDQFFTFVRDAIDDPRTFEAIPNGSALMFRDLVRQGQSIRLTAYLPKMPGARWGARVSGVSAPNETPALHNRRGLWPSVAGYDTAEAALDALEAEIDAGEQSVPVARRAVGA